MTWVLYTLTGSGGLLELAGIIVGALALRSRSRALRKFESRRGTVQFTIAPVLAEAAVAGDVLSGQETDEEGIKLLEKRIRSQSERLAARLETINSTLSDQINNRATDVDRNLRTIIEGVRDLATGTARNGRDAWWSLGLLVAGLLLQSAGNILQIAIGN